VTVGKLRKNPHRNYWCYNGNLLLHPPWKSWSTESWPEFPTMDTFKYISFPGKDCQQKGRYSID